MYYVEVLEGFEVAIVGLLEKMAMCEFYAGIQYKVPLDPQSTENRQRLQTMLDSTLSGLYAAVIVFTVKAQTYYFKAGGMCIEYI